MKIKKMNRKVRGGGFKRVRSHIYFKNILQL